MRWKHTTHHIINADQWHILKSSGKKKSKEELHSFCQNTKGTEEKANLKGTTGTAHLHGSAR
jgi:hypothetical protein